MKNRLFLLLFSIGLFYASNIQTVLIGVKTLITSEGKNVTIFYDLHSPSEYDQKQLNGFVQSLSQQEQENGASLRIYIEQPSQLAKLCAKPHVLTHLHEYVKKAQLATAIKNAEVRCVSGAAYYILGKQNPTTIRQDYQYNAGDTWCTVSQITFKKLFDEFQELKKKIDDYYETSKNNNLRRIYQQYIQLAVDDYNTLKGKLKKQNIEANKRILEYAKILADRSQIGKAKRLSTYVVDTFSPLFQLSLLKKIHSSHRKKIVVITGAYHANALHSMLLNMNASQIYSIDNAPFLTKNQIYKGLVIKRSPLISSYTMPILCLTILISIYYRNVLYSFV